MDRTGILGAAAAMFFMAAAAAAQTKAEATPKPAGGDIDSVALLGVVCGEHNPEPACAALPDLSPDDAWLVLNHVCDLPSQGTSDPCVTFKQRRGGALILNMKTNRWTAEWEQAAYPLKFDVTGAPTLRLRPRDARPLKIVVEEISPLAYSAAPGVPREEDLGVVAGLKSFLALAGTGIQGLVQTITFSAAAGLTTTGGVFKPSADVPIGFGKKAPPAPPPAPDCHVASPDVGDLAEQVTRRMEQLVELGAAMRALEKALDALDAARSGFVRAVQQAEDGKPVTAAQFVAPNLADLTRAYDSFDAAARVLAEGTDRLAACQPLLHAYATLLGAPPDATVIHDLATRVSAIGGCTDASVGRTRASLRANAARLADPVIAEPALCTPAKLKAILDLHRDAMKPFVERLLNARQVEEKVWAAVDKASNARRDVLAAADVLNRQVQRARRHTWNNTLIRSLVVTRPNPDLPWNKLQSHEIVITADTPYVKELSLAYGASEKRPYKLESATGQLLGFGVGLIYTPLHESTFTAVTRPGTSTKVIAETKRETRAGDLAAFVSYRFMEHRPAKRTAQPTLDFGVGVTSDRPAFFLGLGLEILRAARIGAGWSPQRVTALASGQTPNVTEVSSTDDIRTEKRFAMKNYYVSFTFALDSLSLFNSK